MNCNCFYWFLWYNSTDIPVGVLQLRVRQKVQWGFSQVVRLVRTGVLCSHRRLGAGVVTVVATSYKKQFIKRLGQRKSEEWHLGSMYFRRCWIQSLNVVTPLFAWLPSLWLAKGNNRIECCSPGLVDWRCKLPMETATNSLTRVIPGERSAWTTNTNEKKLIVERWLTSMKTMHQGK